MRSYTEFIKAEVGWTVIVIGVALATPSTSVFGLVFVWAVLSYLWSILTWPPEVSESLVSFSGKAVGSLLNFRW
jgi:hypothetical protein